MDKIIINGGTPLRGEVKVSGSKNSVLPLLFSSLLVEGTHIFHNVPVLKDIETTCLLLEHLGCRVLRKQQTLIINNQKNVRLFTAPYQLVRQMRAGILSLGPLLARHGVAEVSLPGGCAIGTRAVNLHLEGLKRMGARFEIKKGIIVGKVDGQLKGCSIDLEFPTVGGTENLMMAACLAEGPTFIKNAACEPEVVDLASYLIKMGVVITGAGTNLIKIYPSQLKSGEHRAISDRIEAGTLLLAGAITKGRICIRDCPVDHLKTFLLKLRESGFFIEMTKDTVSLDSPSSFSAVNIVTAPYPAFPTDLQAQFMALLTQAEGTSTVKETIFENRFMHIQELVRLGANIRLNHYTAYIKGKTPLQGAPVTATDLRASACLILAGLAAQGNTVVHRVYHLDRGYEGLENKLSILGAEIKRQKS